MKAVLKFTFSVLVSVSLMGCAERYRDADPGRTASEIEGLLLSLEGRVATQGTGLPSAMLMAKDPSTTIYFAESFRSTSNGQAAMGPVEVVTPIHFWEFGFNFDLSQVNTVKAFFLQNIDIDGRYNYALILDINDDQLLAVANDSNSQLAEAFIDDDGLFRVEFQLSNGKILVVESDDTSQGELNDVVQLQLYILDNQGEFAIGQISTMVGFLGS